MVGDHPAPSGNSQSAILREASLALVSQLSLEPLLETLVEKACLLAHARYGALGVLGDDGRITSFVTFGLSSEERERIGAPPSGRGVLGLLMTEKQPIRLEDLSQHPASVGFPEGHPPMRSFLGVPVFTRGRVYGNLYLTERQGAAAFTKQDEDILTAFAVFAAVAIENAQQYEESQHRRRELQTLLETGKVMVSSLRTDETLDRIVKASLSLLRADGAHIVLNDETRWTLLTSTEQSGPLHSGSSNLLFEEDWMRRVMDDPAPLVVQDVKADLPELGLSEPAIHVGSLAFISIRAGVTVYGALGVSYRDSNRVPANAGPLLEWMADRAAVALRNADLYRREAQDRGALDAIFQSLSEGVYTVDRELRIQRTNPSAAMLAGRPMDAGNGLLCREFFHYLDDEGSSVCDTACPARIAMETGEPVVRREVFLRPRGDGRQVPVDLSATPLRDDEGRVVGAVEVVQDASQRHAADALRQHIISLVSHELRTPLGHIKGYASSLVQPDVEWDQETQKEFINGILVEADRMARLVSDILDLSRLESGREETERLPTPIEAPVRAGIAQVRTLTQRHHVDVSIPQVLPLALIDQAQIERVVSNLVENAAKYSPEGTRISVSAEEIPGWICVCVADQGYGIPADQLARVFEKFVRLKVPAGRPIPGTGLGLPLCKVIIEGHGGRLWAESALGQGSRFYFTLPVADLSET
jgi:PAS domain S-box-containing protein